MRRLCGAIARWSMSPDGYGRRAAPPAIAAEHRRPQCGPHAEREHVGERGNGERWFACRLEAASRLPTPTAPTPAARSAPKSPLQTSLRETARLGSAGAEPADPLDARDWRHLIRCAEPVEGRAPGRRDAPVSRQRAGPRARLRLPASGAKASAPRCRRAARITLSRPARLTMSFAPQGGRPAGARPARAVARAPAPSGIARASRTPPNTAWAAPARRGGRPSRRASSRRPGAGALEIVPAVDTSGVTA
jgi:hypothetical protein